MLANKETARFPDTHVEKTVGKVLSESIDANQLKGPDALVEAKGPSKSLPNPQLSNEKNLGWLFDIGDYTTQLYRDINKPL